MHTKNITCENNMDEVNRVLKDCIECKVRPARYWASSFCEDCFRELLKEKLKEDDRSNEPKKDVSTAKRLR